MDKEKYSLYLEPDNSWCGDYGTKWEAQAAFDDFDRMCDKECIGMEKVLYHGEEEIARATIKDLTIFK
jgi:hypothetical protein